MKKRTAILVIADLGNEDIEYTISELKNLAEACNLEVDEVFTQKLDRVNPSTYIGKGKVDEISNYIEAFDIDVVVFNDELTPAQIRNLENKLQEKVIDRTLLILDIFARRAKTKEATLQVEIAQLKYMLPRLVGLGTSLSRQEGGIGMRGPGEKKIEVDRRRIRSEIDHLSYDLKKYKQGRKIQRRRRNKSEIPVVSLVGYTNAGKSTLMNSILSYSEIEEEKHVYTEDMLFATLETSTRRIQLVNKKEFLLTDTVGFVSKLPHHLVEAFKSTLEEVTEADLIVHVVDTSNENYKKQIEVTNEVLKKLNVENIPMIYAFNKIDLVSDEFFSEFRDSILISARIGDNIEKLIELICDNIFEKYYKVNFLIPFDRGDIYSYFKEHANVLSTDYVDNGILVNVEVSKKDYNKYLAYID